MTEHLNITHEDKHSSTKVLNISNVSTTLNPISLVHFKSNVDPATTTNIQVSTSANMTSSSYSDSEPEFLHSHQILSNNNNTINNDNNDRLSSPTRTSRSLTVSATVPNESTEFSNNKANNNSYIYDADYGKSIKSQNSSSHSKLSDLAHKVSDYLFSTRRSIDIQNPNCSSSTDSSSKNGSANPSPIPSRNNSHISLSSLARTSARQLKTKRRSFLLRSNLSPSRDNTNSNLLETNRNNSSSSLYSSSIKLNNINTTPCHFACNESDGISRSDSTHVKETHYVHVEYDPITRKRVLNTYEILKDLGSGQHGKVKLAKDISTDKLVAIKIVDRTGKPSLMLNRLSRNNSQSQEDKIRKEIAIMKKCDHPHVVKLIEVLDAENSRKIYLVLEYLEKGEVKWQLSKDDVINKINSNVSGDITNNIIDDCIPEPLLPMNKTKKIFRDVVSGLEYLHHQGIIHRDIKPSNLLVSKDDEVKISDFGVSFAANLDGQHQDDLELAKTAGTPAFLAPELCSTDNKQMKVTYKIDIWALGVTLYCLVFGDLPFYADSEYQLFEKINNDDVKFPNMTRWRVAEKLSDSDFHIVKDLILKLLEKNPDNRIEIDEIKKHPFLLDALKDGVWKDDYAGWNKNMKIDVSNKEVDEAVVGLGNRIKKKITAALRKKKILENDNNGSSNDSLMKHQKDIYPNNLFKNMHIMGLKDDCSYILSEEANKNSQSTLSFSQSNNFEVSNNFGQQLNLPKENSFAFSSPTSSDNPLSASSPVIDEECSFNDEKYSDQSKIDKIINNEMNESQHEDLDSDIEENENNDEEYDYRRELAEGDERRNSSVQLAINPSFASLDSFYDDSYAKFMSPTSHTNSTFSYLGSFSNRNAVLPNRNSNRIPITTSNRGSPNLIPTTGFSDGFSHSSDTRESLNMVRKHSNSPSTGGLFITNVANQLNNLRGKAPKKISPVQSTVLSTGLQRSPVNARNQQRNAIPTSNPMLNGNQTNRKTSVQNEFKIKNPMFSNMSDSSDSENNDNSTDKNKHDNTHLEYNRKSNSEFQWSNKNHGSSISGLISNNNNSNSRRAIFTSGNGDSEEDDDDDDDNEDDFFSQRHIPPMRKSIITTATPSDDSDDYFSKRNIQPVTTSVENSNNNDYVSKNLTKSSIYGTKLNLISHAYNNHSEEEDDGSSDDELFLSFGKTENKPKTIPHTLLPNETPAALTTHLPDPNLVSADNVFSVSTPTIVDVPANIYHSQSSSMGDKNTVVNSSFIVPKSDDIADKVAALNINGGDDVVKNQ
jgi:[calcium/calmodulin-dependent protein kinase] kinase